nr:right-handed parallel beta-helix repeat-containing protein [Pirellulales bacterium]
MLSAADLTDWAGGGNTSSANNYVVASPTSAGGTFATRVTPSAHLSDASLVGSVAGSTTAFDFTENLSISGTLSFTNPSNVDPNIFFGFYNSAGTSSTNTHRLGIAFADSSAGFFRAQMQGVNGAAVTTLNLDTNGATAGGTQPLAAGTHAFSISYTAATGAFTAAVGPVSFSTTLAAGTFQVAGNADKLDRFGFLQLNATNVETTYTLNVQDINYTGETQLQAPVDSADFDGDDDVDGADFLTWQRGLGLGSQASNENGDANHSSAVDGADLTVWALQFGASTGETAPAAPTSLAAVAVSSSQIDLAWADNAVNETGFEIDRATNSAFTTGLVTTPAGVNATSYSATGLAASTEYWFRVRATNAVGDSANSLAANATTSPVAGSTFYLDLDSGSLTGDGSVGNPWRTMDQAIRHAPSTAFTVLIANGNYPAAQTTILTAPIRTGLVTFKPATAGGVTLAGLIDWKNVTDMRLEGFNFTNFVQVRETENFQYVNNDVTNAGIAVYGADGALVEGNNFHSYTAGYAAILFRSYNTFLISGSNPRDFRAENLVIRNNTVDLNNQPGDAIHVESGSNNLIEKNTIRNVLTTGAEHGDSIQLVEVDTSTITGNIITGGRGIIVHHFLTATGANISPY